MVSSILKIIEVVMLWLTPKQTIIRLKNELKQKEYERKVLLSQKCTTDRIEKLKVLDNRIGVIARLLYDHATD